MRRTVCSTFFQTMDSINRNLTAHIVAFLTVAVWGSTFISTKVLIMNGLSAAQIFTLRFAMAYVLMVCFSHRRWVCTTARDELTMLLLGVTGGSLYFLTENVALKYSTATNVSLIVCSCPLFTTLLFRLLFRSARLSMSQWAGTLFAFAGMVAVVLNGHFVLHLSPAGDSLALAACICWAVYSLIMKTVGEGYSSAFITRKVFFYGLLTILPYYLFCPGMPSIDVLSQPVVAANLLFLGAIASMVCFLTWTWCMKQLGAIKATNYVYINPIATIVFATWILDEHITPWFVAGTLFILLGLYLSNKDARPC